jgi:aryl carrier-like protein
MSFEDWAASLSPKVRGSWNLHTLLPEKMDFFIFLSSLSGIIGRETQANYSAANTYMDTLAQYRISLNKKAVAIDLGILEEDGLLAEDQELMARVKSSGALIPIVSKEFQAILEYYCNPALKISTTKQCQPLIGLQIPANLIARNLEPSPFMYLPTFRHLFQISSSEQALSSSSNQSTNISALFATAGSLAEAGHIVAKALIERLSSTTAVPVEAISDDKAMHEYGVDSLVAIEIRNWFAKKVGADVAVFDILGDMSINAIATSAAGKSTYNKAGWVVE